MDMLKNFCTDNTCYIRLIIENFVICFNTFFIRLMIENWCNTVYYIIICSPGFCKGQVV